MLSLHNFKIIAQFSDEEQQQFVKFLQSPYSNSNIKLTKVFGIIQQAILTKQYEIEETIFVSIFPDINKNKQHFYDATSQLFRMIEQFLILQDVEKDFCLQQQLLQKALHQKQLDFTISSKKTNASSEFYLHVYKQQLFSHHHILLEDLVNISSLEHAFYHFDIYALIEKLRLACSIISAQSFDKQEIDFSLLELLLQRITLEDLEKHALLAIYFYTYKMLQQPESETYFNQLQPLIYQHVQTFPKTEMREIILQANNFCIKRMNRGEEVYFRKSFELYKLGIEEKIVLESGLLSRFTFTNVVTIALRLKEIDWTKSFIENNKKYIEEKFRESTYSFNKAKLWYTQKLYDKTIQLLQQADYDDILLNLSAKTILLKIYVELNYFDALEYHIQSMRKFITRKKIEPFYKNNFTNICKLTLKLMEFKSSKKTHKEQDNLKATIQQTNPCSEKAWLLEQIQ